MKPALVAVGFVMILLVEVLALQIRWSPRFIEMGPDSGLFAYNAQRIINGDLLYRDVFDHKPPGVFYMDAAAFRLGGETVWPLWMLSATWIAATAVVLFWILRSLTGSIAALAATSLFVVVLSQSAVYQGGNSTELFALLPQVLAVAATAAYFRHGKKRDVFLLGIATAMALLFKPTYIALGVVSLAVILSKGLGKQEWRGVVELLFAFFAGLLLPVLLVIAYWYLRGGLADLVNAVLLFNAAYIRGGLSVRSLYVTLRKLTQDAPMANLTMLAIAGTLLFFRGAYLVRGTSAADEASGGQENDGGGLFKHSASPIFLVALVAIPLEWALVAISGQNFGHYFITPLPAMAIMAAFALGGPKSAASKDATKEPWRSAYAGLIYVLLVVGLLLGIVQAMPDRYEWSLWRADPYGGDVRTPALVKYVAENSSSGDRVLVWGNLPGVNFQADRLAPSRYLFASHLFLDDGRMTDRLDEFLNAIEKTRPTLVAQEIDSEVGIPPILSVEDSGCRQCSADARAAWVRLRESMSVHYGNPANVGGWMVYRRLDGLPAE